MKWFVTLTVLVFSFQLFAITAEDLSGRIVINGYSDEFTEDEFILNDSTGILLEYPNDSRWGENNDIQQIRLTWDLSYLYVAVDAICWDNNVVLFFDVYDDYGIDNMEDLNTWKRLIWFSNSYPDFFLATWDTNTNPQAWMVKEGYQHEAVEWSGSGFEDFATFNTGAQGRSLEAKIPWSAIYYSDERSMLNYPYIKLVAMITGGADYSSSPDAAPDNLGGMPDDTERVVLDNYVEINVDQDGDGQPDMGVLPNRIVTYFKSPPFDSQRLKVDRIRFLNGKVFAPTRGEKVEFLLEPNRDMYFYVEIYDLNGKRIGRAVEVDALKWEWNGRDRDGNRVPFGVYILRFVAITGETSHREAVVVVN